MTSQDVAISLENLSLEVGGKTLLEKVNFCVHKGEFLLLVGPSGAGKSMLLQLLAGLPTKEEVQVQGKVKVFGKSLPSSSVGIVFQDHALFDEFSAYQNVRFAMDHAPRRWGWGEKQKLWQELLKELELEVEVPVHHLSGGQKRRLALARTLAYGSDILLFDEPTAGLDPKRAKQAAFFLQRIHQQFQKTILVVTHEYRYLADYASRIVLLDPCEKTLRPIAKEELETCLVGVGEGEEKAKPPASLWKWGRLFSFFQKTGQWVFFLLSVFWYLLPLWRHPLWGLRFFYRYFRLLAFPSSLFYLLLSGGIVGFIVTYFVFQFLPYKEYNEPLLMDDILAALGFTLYRILIPLLGCILIAARGVAAVTADVGNWAYTKKLDAMRSLSASPDRYIFTGILYSFLVSTPLLILCAFFAARLASVTVFTFTHPEDSPYFWDVNFHYLLRQREGLFYYGTEWMMGKILLSALVMACVSYYLGSQPKSSGQEISLHLTKAIIWATLGVLLVHLGFAFFEFQEMYPS